MTSGPNSQVYRYIRSIRRSLDRLEGLLREMEAQAPEPRPADPRSELLEQVHVAGAIEQRRLFELLDQRGMAHTWIGAQVSSEYLDLWHAADQVTIRDRDTMYQVRLPISDLVGVLQDKLEHGW